MQAELACYLACLESAGLVIPMFLAMFAVMGGIGAYLVTRRGVMLLVSQGSMSAFITANILLMTCPMFDLLWVYLGVILIGTLVLGIAKHGLALRHKDMILGRLGFMDDLEDRFNVSIDILDTQKTKAYAYRKKIFLSMGLMEMLDRGELEAVVAHETYHVRNSPDKFVASFLALTSLMFIRHTDERDADRFAAEVAGRENLESAVRKLDPANWEKRMAAVE